MPLFASASFVPCWRRLEELAWLYHPKSHGRCWREPPPPTRRGRGVDHPPMACPSMRGSDRRRKAGGRPDGGECLYCHGNAGNVGASRRQRYLAAGARGSRPCSSSIAPVTRPAAAARPRRTGCYAAADAAFAWLTAVRGQVPPTGSWSSGRSLGAGVAVATLRRPRRTHRAGWSCYKPFHVFPGPRCGKNSPGCPGRRLLHNRFDNCWARSPPSAPRCSVAHGTADRLVPFHHGRRLFDAAPSPKPLSAAAGPRP